MHCYISQIEQLCFSEPLSSFDSIHFVGSTNESELAFGICEKISQVGSIRGKGMRGEAKGGGGGGGGHYFGQERKSPKGGPRTLAG